MREGKEKGQKIKTAQPSEGAGLKEFCPGARDLFTQVSATALWWPQGKALPSFQNLGRSLRPRKTTEAQKGEFTFLKSHRWHVAMTRYVSKLTDESHSWPTEFEADTGHPIISRLDAGICLTSPLPG